MSTVRNETNYVLSMDGLAVDLMAWLGAKYNLTYVINYIHHYYSVIVMLFMMQRKVRMRAPGPAHHGEFE